MGTLGAVTVTVTVQAAPPMSVTESSEMFVPAAFRLPPHVFAGGGANATVKPEGKASVKPMPVSVRVGLGFVSVKVRLTVPPGSTLRAAKAFLRIGGRFVSGFFTVNVPDPGFPLPPFDEPGVTVLTLGPSVVPLTVRLTEQEAPIAKVTFEIEIELEVTTIAPPQVLLKLLGFGIMTPLGKVSMKLTPVRATMFSGGLTRFIVNTEVSSTKIIDGRKDFVKSGGATIIRSADAGSEGRHPVQVAGPATLCLGFGTKLVPVTMKGIMHDPPLAIVAPDRDTELAVIVNVPPHSADVPTGLATSPGGMGSFTATPITGTATGLPIVIDAGVGVLTGMLVTVNAFDNVRILGRTTVRVASAGSPLPPLIDVGVAVLSYIASLLLVTSTLNIQLLFTGMVTAGGAAVKVMMVEPGTAVGAVPKQVP